MSEILIFVVAGLTSGAIYGLVATGLALTYKTSGILNFAQGALAIVAVDAYIYLTVNRGYSWELSAVVSVFVVGAAMGLLFEVLGRVLVRSAPALRVAATVGVLLAIQGGSALIAPHLVGSTPHFSPPPLPDAIVRIGGVNVSEDQLIIMAVSLAVMLVLYVFLTFTRVGVSMRAVVDDPDLVDCCGRNPKSLRRLAWVIGCTFAALSGVLLAMAPAFGPGSPAIAGVVIPAFGAAAIGLFTNLPMAYLGGLVIGISASLLTRYLTADWLRSLPSALPVVVLFVALMVTPRRRLTERWGSAHRVSPPPRLGRGATVIASVVVLVALPFVPSWSGFEINLYTTCLVFVLLFLSLGMLVRTSGQVSLCHLGLAAVGTTTFGHFASGFGMPWLVALVGAGVVTAAVGVIVALTAIRLAGVFVALATLAFGFILEEFFYGSTLMFGHGEAIAAPRPFGASDNHFYFVVLGIVAAASAVVMCVNRTRMGRLLRGMADSPRVLEAQGTTVSVTKLVVFALSAFLAGLAGALYASLNTVVSPTAFAATNSLTLVAVLFVIPISEPWYAVAAAVAYYLLPVKLDVQSPGAWTALVFGAASVLTVSVFLQPDSLPARAWERLRSLRARPAPEPREPSPAAPTPAVVHVAREHRVQEGLTVTDVTVRFGGLLALDGVGLAAPVGRVTGLIGPNGAGKTTLFDVCSGLVRPVSGKVRPGGRDLSRLGAAARARRGLGRTFQQGDQYGSMSVRDTLALGREAGMAGADPRAQLFPHRGDARAVAGAVDDAVALTGIHDLLDVPIARVSTGERRLVELARCLAGDFDVILLDEPSAGLDRSETDHLKEVVRRVVVARDVGVLLVEHDMAVVMDLCEYIYVIDFGRLIYEGAPWDVTNSPLVRAAYLGDPTLTETA